MSSISLRYWSFSVLWLCYCFIYFTRKPLGIIKTDLEKGYGYARVTIGMLDSALLLPYSIFQIVLGNLGDSINPTKLLIICILSSGFSTLFMGPLDQLYSLVIFLFLNGTFQAFCWPLSIKIVSILFENSNNKNFVLGIFGTSTFAGGTLGTFLSVFIKDRLSWRWVYPIPSVLIIGMGLSLLLFFKWRMKKLMESFKIAEIGNNMTLKDSRITYDMHKKEIFMKTRNDALSPVLHSPEIKKSFWVHAKKSLLLFWNVPLILHLSIAMFCLKMIRYIFYMWLPFLLEYKNNFSSTKAGNISALFEVGGVIGSVLLGLIMDKVFHKTQFVGIIYFLFIHIIMVFGFILSTDPSWHWLINSSFLLLAGVMNGGVDNLLSSSVPLLISSCFRVESPSALIGLINGFGSLGTFLEGPLVGLVLDMSSSKTFRNHKITKLSDFDTSSPSRATLSSHLLNSILNETSLSHSPLTSKFNQSYDYLSLFNHLNQTNGSFINIGKNLTGDIHHTTNNYIDFTGFFYIIGVFSVIPALVMLAGYLRYRHVITTYCREKDINNNQNNHIYTQNTLADQTSTNGTIEKEAIDSKNITVPNSANKQGYRRLLSSFRFKGEDKTKSRDKSYLDTKLSEDNTKLFEVNIDDDNCVKRISNEGACRNVNFDKEVKDGDVINRKSLISDSKFDSVTKSDNNSSFLSVDD